MAENRDATMDANNVLRGRSVVTTRVLIVAMAASLALMGLGTTVSYGQSDCDEPDGTVHGALTGPSSTEGEITSNSPLLDGAKTELQITETASGAGLDGVPDPTLSYVGDFTITDTDGDRIDATDTGIFDTKAGTFSSIMTIDGGTGKYVGADGVVFPHGVVQPDGTFAAPFTGEVCLTDD